MSAGPSTLAHTEQWLFNKYCGFLKLSLKDWQGIQDRLMEEQLELIAGSPWAEAPPWDKRLRSVEEFRARAPLTTYSAYANRLEASRQARSIPSPYRWAYTTGPGGAARWVPYTESALAQAADLVMSAFVLGAAREEGEVAVREGDRVIYNVAPPPYVTGLIARIMAARFRLRSLPPLDVAEKMEFRDRVEAGFRQALRTGVDALCSLSSVLISMGEYLERGRSARRSRTRDWHLGALSRQARGALLSGLRQRPLRPCDLVPVKSVVAWGLDTSVYREQIARYWGREPIEFHASTEGGVLGMQSWKRGGLTPVPYSAYLEFLPEEDVAAHRRDPEHPLEPRLLGELAAGRRYEVVVSSFHAMPFLRYRTGHMVRVLSLDTPAIGGHLPQLELVGRSDNVIDLSGFSRLDEKTLWQAIAGGSRSYTEWAAAKEFDHGHAALHIYIDGPLAASCEVFAEDLHERLKRLDSDYADIERMLGFKSLRVEALAPGTFARWSAARVAAGGNLADQRFPRMNPPRQELEALLRASEELKAEAGGRR